jgi:DNA-binding NtrC family response regulator
VCVQKEDIPILVEYFVKHYADKAGKRTIKIDSNRLDLCDSYDWPGNIWELQNIVRTIGDPLQWRCLPRRAGMAHSAQRESSLGAEKPLERAPELRKETH